MMKFIVLILLIAPIVLISQNQIFNGKLTYTSIPNEISRHPISMSLGDRLVTFRIDTTDREVIVKDSLLLDKRSFKDGMLIGVIQQEGSDVNILSLTDLKRKIHHPYISPKRHNIISREKTKETKYILGLLCRKFTYITNNAKIIAWIPNNSPYLKQREYGEYFDIYFFPDGLAFEIDEVSIDGANKFESITKLIKMEIFEPSQDDFDEFIENASKQPIDPQFHKF